MTRVRFNSTVFIIFVVCISSFGGAFFWSVLRDDGNVFPLFRSIYSFANSWQELIASLVAISAAIYGAYPVWKQLSYNKRSVLKERIRELSLQRSKLMRIHRECVGINGINKLMRIKKSIDVGAEFVDSFAAELHDFRLLVGEYIVYYTDDKGSISKELNELLKQVESIFDYALDALKKEDSINLKELEENVLEKMTDLSDQLDRCNTAYRWKIRKLTKELEVLEAE